MKFVIYVLYEIVLLLFVYMIMKTTEIEEEGK